MSTPQPVATPPPPDVGAAPALTPAPPSPETLVELRWHQRPMVQLLIYRWRITLRDPDTFLWGVLLPAVLAVALGFAFRPSPLPPTQVQIIMGPGAQSMEALLEGVPDLDASRVEEKQGLRSLRRGSIHLLIRPGEVPELVADPTRPEARTAQLQVTEALRDQRGDPAPPPVIEQTWLKLPGMRYIDFLIPALIAMSLMMSTTVIVGATLAQLKNGKLLKRFAASPMPRGMFYAALGAIRLIFTGVEVALFLVVGRLVFDMPVSGSYLQLLAFALLGCVTWSMLSVVLGLLAKNYETFHGLQNLATTVLIFSSGAFFSLERLPDWVRSAFSFFPLTASVEGMRAIILEGTSVTALWPQLAVLGVWAVVPFLVSIRFLRWT